MLTLKERRPGGLLQRVVILTPFILLRRMPRASRLFLSVLPKARPDPSVPFTLTEPCQQHPPIPSRSPQLRFRLPSPRGPNAAAPTPRSETHQPLPRRAGAHLLPLDLSAPADFSYQGVGVALQQALSTPGLITLTSAIRREEAPSVKIDVAG
jgi:hypothetical protein